MKFILLFLFVITVNCGDNTLDVQSQIVKRIEQNCTERVGCVFEMLGTTPFAWDKLYVFRPGLLDVEITKIIGKEVSFRGEFSNKYVFLKDDKIVYTEEHYINADRFEDGTVMFGTTDKYDRFALIDESSKFDVRIDRRQSGTTYYLTCTTCEK